jgi:hypothetical protein
LRHGGLGRRGCCVAGCYIICSCLRSIFAGQWQILCQTFGLRIGKGALGAVERQRGLLVFAHALLGFIAWAAFAPITALTAVATVAVARAALTAAFTPFIA